MRTIFSVIILGTLQEALCDSNSSWTKGRSAGTWLRNVSSLKTDVSSEDCPGINTPVCKIYNFSKDTWQTIQQEFHRNLPFEIIYRTKPKVTHDGTVIFCEASQRSDKNCSSDIDSFRHQRRGTKCHLLFDEEPTYRLLDNGSAVDGENYLMDGIEHVFINNTLYECEDMHDNASTNYFGGSLSWLTYVSYVGCALSVASLLMYLVVYMCTPKLKNLPGYILTSMNISLLLAYTSYLISQLPQVVGTSCLLSAIFLHYFFLASFFWMNVFAFDVFRALRNATKKLLVGSGAVGIRFALYSFYAWGIPLVLKIAATVVHYHPDSPEHMVPVFGNDTCMFSNSFSKVYFFFVPTATILLANTFLYIGSVIIMVHHKMRDGKPGKAAKKNFMLQLRFGIFMGLTWVLGIIVPFVESEVLDFFYIILNSTQGIFIAVLFCCTEKVSRYGSMRLRSFSRSSSQRTNRSSNG